MARYDPRVAIRWNESAYANAGLLVNWIQEFLVHALPSGPRLLTLDVARFHSTDEVLTTLRSNNITPSMIPPGCTGLVHPLDVSVNKPFKNLLRNILEDSLDTYEAQHQVNLRELRQTDTTAIAERRILVTHAVGEAWEKFGQTYQELVVTTFRKLGLTLPINGSCDDELSIKGIDPLLLRIGDWRIEEGGGLNHPEDAGERERVLHEMNNEDYGRAVDYVDREWIVKAASLN